MKELAGTVGAEVSRCRVRSRGANRYCGCALLELDHTPLIYSYWMQINEDRDSVARCGGAESSISVSCRSVDVFVHRGILFHVLQLKHTFYLNWPEFWLLNEVLLFD